MKTKEKRKKKFYKIKDKISLLDLIKQGVKKRYLLKKYDVNPSTLSNWIKNEEKLRVSNEDNKFTMHQGPKLKICEKESFLINFIRQKNSNKQEIYTRDVIKEAIKISPYMKQLSKKAVYAWVYRFLKRNSIILKPGTSYFDFSNLDSNSERYRNYILKNENSHLYCSKSLFQKISKINVKNKIFLIKKFFENTKKKYKSDIDTDGRLSDSSNFSCCNIKTISNFNKENYEIRSKNSLKSLKLSKLSDCNKDNIDDLELSTISWTSFKSDNIIHYVKEYLVDENPFEN